MIDSLGRSGGAEQALAAMAPMWMRAGTDLTVYSLGGRQDLHDGLETAGARVRINPTHDRRSTVRWLQRELVHERQDLVHTTLFEADVLGRTAAKASGLPVVSSLVATPYGRDHSGERGLLRRRVALAHALDSATGRTVVGWQAVSEHVASVMSRRLLIPRDRIAVILAGRTWWYWADVRPSAHGTFVKACVYRLMRHSSSQRPDMSHPRDWTCSSEPSVR